MANPKLTKQCSRSVAGDECARSVSPGSRVGDFALLKEVGGGSWSRVFRAAHVHCGQVVAIKLLTSRHAAPPAAGSKASVVIRATTNQQCPADVGMLRREAEVATAVSHPGLVRLKSAQLEKPPFFLVLEWVDGTSLQQWIERGAGLPVPAALWIVRQVAEALDALQQAGFVHRDVKPANILVTGQGRAKLVDYGLAQPTTSGPPCGTGHTQSHCDPPYTLAGTANYLAPELAGGGASGDIRSDIYSLGVTLYELITGRLPFPAGDLADTLQHQRQSRPKLHCDALVRAPVLGALLGRMLAKEPLRRPQTPAELVALLRRHEIECFDDWHGAPVFNRA